PMGREGRAGGREGGPGGPGGTPGGREGAPPAPGAAPGGEGAQPAPGGRGGRGFGQNPTFRRELAEFLRSEGAAAVLQDAGKPHSLLTTTGSWQGFDRPSASEPMASLYVAHEHYAL